MGYAKTAVDVKFDNETNRLFQVIQSIDNSTELKKEIAETQKILQFPIDKYFTVQKNVQSKSSEATPKDELKEDTRVIKDTTKAETDDQLAQDKLRRELESSNALVNEIDKAIVTFMSGSQPKQIEIIRVTNVMHDVLTRLDETIKLDENNKRIYRDMRRGYRKLQDAEKILNKKSIREEVKLGNPHTPIDTKRDLSGEVDQIKKLIVTIQKTGELDIDIEDALTSLKNTVKGTVKNYSGKSKNEAAIKDNIVKNINKLKKASAKLQGFANPKILMNLFLILNDLKAIQTVKKDLINKAIEFAGILLIEGRDSEIMENNLKMIDKHIAEKTETYKRVA